MHLYYRLALLPAISYLLLIPSPSPPGRYHRDILSDKDCEHVYELVYSSHRAVAQAAGEFLNERLFIPDEVPADSLRTKRGKRRRPNTPLIRDLVQFFIESEVSPRGLR